MGPKLCWRACGEAGGDGWAIVNCLCTVERKAKGIRL